MPTSPSPRPEGWTLKRRARLSTGEEIAYDVSGQGSPMVLVYGTPSRSCIWAAVAPALAERHAVYVLDLLGFGMSRGTGHQDTSIPAQSRAIAELIRRWGLAAPGIVGHDIGGAVVLRTHLLERVPFSRIALVDAVVLRPWITPTTRHKQTYAEAYRTMPNHIFHSTVLAHLRTATALPIDEAAFAAIFGQWEGEDGQARYMHNLEQFDERFTDEFEPLLGSIRVPVRIVWGKRDAWLNPAFAHRLLALIPGAELSLIPGAGHFSMLDRPDEVAQELTNFFALS